VRVAIGARKALWRVRATAERLSSMAGDMVRVEIVARLELFDVRLKSDSFNCSARLGRSRRTPDAAWHLNHGANSRLSFNCTLHYVE